MLSLLDMVFETRGRLPTFEVRGALGCRLVTEGFRMGRLLLLSAMVSSATGECGGTSPRLETRLSRERATVDLERLWLLLVPVLRGGRGSAKEEGLDGNEGVIEGAEGCLCLCLCGLGERRDVMSTIAASQRIGRKEGFGGYMCMYSVVLFVCNSSTVVQYNSVTRPPLSVMHLLSEAKWDVLVLCLCSVGGGDGDGENKTLTRGPMEMPLYSMYHNTLFESINQHNKSSGD